MTPKEETDRSGQGVAKRPDLNGMVLPPRAAAHSCKHNGPEKRRLGTHVSRTGPTHQGNRRRTERARDGRAVYGEIGVSADSSRSLFCLPIDRSPFQR